MLLSEETQQPEGKKKAIWKQEIINKLGIVGEQKKAVDSCIYKVPSKLRKVKEDAYNPQLVSIGPFHRETTDLADAMRERKWFYMLSFIQQTDNEADSRKCLKDCMDAIYDLDDEVRQCYAETIKYDKEELAKIMLLDGCFILELFLLFHAKKVDGPDWMIAALQHDLALLENQIPFIVLVKLYKIVKPSAVFTQYSVACLALKFFMPIAMSEKQIPEKDNHTLGTEFKHFLDLLHIFYFLEDGSRPMERPEPSGEVSIPFNIINEEMISTTNEHRSAAVEQTSLCLCLSNICKKGKQQISSPSNKWGFNYCASELSESGVKFDVPLSSEGSSHKVRIKDKDKQLLSIDFKNGVLIIPQLIINEATSSVLRNLIAYEQYSLSSTKGVTSYAFLMGSLIHSSADAKLLRDSEIITHNRIGDNEYLSQFKDIVGEVDPRGDFYFAETRDQVNEYCKSWCNLNKLRVFLKVRIQKEIKVLSNKYFSSTWSFASFVAATVILLLSFLQTYYIINPRS